MSGDVTGGAPAAVYQERQDVFGVRRDRARRLSGRISLGRLISFLGAVAALLIGLREVETSRLFWLTGAALLLAGFVALVVLHERVIRAVERLERLYQLNVEALQRLRREWDDLPLAAQPSAGPAAPLARDLDLTGPASLLHLLGDANTPFGRSTLLRWLIRPAPPREVRERQAAVVDLAPRLEWRQEFAAQGRLLRDLPADPEPFLAWAEGSAPLLTRPLFLWVPRLLALATTGLLVAHLAGLMRPVWALLVLVNLLWSGLFARRMYGIFDQVSSHEREFGSYAELLALVGRETLTAPGLQLIQRELGGQSSSARREVSRLSLLVALADMRRNGLFHFPLQLCTLWDFHVHWLLERWRRRAGQRMRSWLAKLGELEALSALAGLRYSHPAWCLPELVEDEGQRLVARELGHPLLPPATCVVNDVELGPRGHYLLVTGSNMSGKSTLLRALGLNVILAQAGGPVCARSLTLPPLELGTSFRVDDSLVAGVSYFMAELRRLKEIVDQAEDGAAGGRTILFLLDEILLGTNITERQVAVRKVILRLLELGCMGAVSTHDLTLASVEELAGRCVPVHFTETFTEEAEGPSMTFDYRLRQGVTPSSNALKLLRLVGL